MGSFPETQNDPVILSSVKTDGKLENGLKREKDDAMPAVITQKIYYGYYNSVP